MVFKTKDGLYEWLVVALRTYNALNTFMNIRPPPAALNARGGLARPLRWILGVQALMIDFLAVASAIVHRLSC